MASKAVSTNSIPLHCNICPKKPDFSDISHLLTHIASKGHLSHYYKTKIRSGSEDASKRLIDQYDAWYAAYSIEDLMSDRLDQKDRRKSRGRVPINPGVQAKLPNLRSRQSASANPLDPRLSQRIKAEPNSRSTSPFVDPTALQRTYGPPMQMWPMTPYMPNPIFKKEDEEQPSSETSSIPLRAIQRRRNYSRSTLEDEDLDIDPASLNDPSKLKGVLWPGMDMFDSAPPDMRRKRNQKKATSVVEQLETMSQIVEATELVFSPSGSLRRARTISGFPDSDSEPLKGEETPPKRKRSTRRLSGRRPLAELNTNANVRTRARRKRDNLSFHGDSRPYYGEDQSDDELTYAKPVKWKRKLAIHRDTEDVDDGTSMSYLTSAYRQPVQQVETYRGDLAMPNPFRPIDPAYFTQGMSTFQPNYLANPFSYEAPMLANSNWDFMGQEFSGQMANPLFMGSYQPVADEDDERTISALASET